MIKESTQKGNFRNGVTALRNMLGGSVQISGEELTSHEVKDICDSLKLHSLKLLSLRGCKIDDKDFRKLMKAFGQCRSILQLNLNLGVVSDNTRATLLSEALNTNRSIESLFMHGTPLGDVGLGLLIKAIAQHPSLISLDLGDCKLGDTGLRMIVTLLPPDGAKEGLLELTLSANPAITSTGWSLLFCAIAASSRLRVLNIDYNNIGDYGAGLFSVAMAGSRSIHTVDMEGCGVNESGAKVILEMLENYPTPLRELILAQNHISESLQDDIENCLTVDDDVSSVNMDNGIGKTFNRKWTPQPQRPIVTPSRSPRLLPQTAPQ